MESLKTFQYYFIKPTTFRNGKRTVGESILLTEAQARPLQSGGFLTFDESAAIRVTELTQTIATLTDEINALKPQKVSKVKVQKTTTQKATEEASE